MKNTKINNFFRAGRRRLDLKTIHEQMPKRLELLRKHNSKISINYGSLHELGQIKKEKDRYVEWIDKDRNHITKSPIYQKVINLKII